MTYRCTFDRIGRDHDVPPQEFVADNAEGLALVVYKFARRYCASREVEVITNLIKGKGQIIVGGFRPAGEFTIEVLA